MNYAARITNEPGKRSGKLCIRGMRFPVFDGLDCLAGGMSIEEALEDFPELTREDVQASLSFAASVARGTHGPHVVGSSQAKVFLPI